MHAHMYAYIYMRTDIIEWDQAFLFQAYIYTHAHMYVYIYMHTETIEWDQAFSFEVPGHDDVDSLITPRSMSQLECSLWRNSGTHCNKLQHITMLCNTLLQN